MNQAFDTQLQVVQRALGEVVLPALGGASGHVIEQLHLSMAALSFMQQRLPPDIIAGRWQVISPWPPKSPCCWRIRPAAMPLTLM